MKEEPLVTSFIFDEVSQLQRVIELSVDDPRDKSLIVYPLCVIATIVILARMAGHNNMRAVYEYCCAHHEHLKKLIYGFGDDIPTPQPSGAYRPY